MPNRQGGGPVPAPPCPGREAGVGMVAQCSGPSRPASSDRAPGLKHFWHRRFGCASQSSRCPYAHSHTITTLPDPQRPTRTRRCRVAQPCRHGWPPPATGGQPAGKHCPGSAGRSRGHKKSAAGRRFFQVGQINGWHCSRRLRPWPARLPAQHCHGPHGCHWPSSRHQIRLRSSSCRLRTC